jgi:hypothetical protein
MKLEVIMLSKIGHSHKDKYGMFSLMPRIGVEGDKKAHEEYGRGKGRGGGRQSVVKEMKMMKVYYMYAIYTCSEIPEFV